MEIWDVDRLRPDIGRPEVLRSDDSAARVIAMTLRDGSTRTHEGYEHGWVMVLDGRLTIESGEQTADLVPGSLAHFSPFEKRKVTAVGDTAVLYLLTPWPGKGHPSTEAARDERRDRDASTSP